MAPGDGLLTLGRWTSDRARISGDRTAVLDRGLGTTYRDLDSRATALADRLQGAGHRRGDVIASLSGNSVDHIVLFFACAKAGLVLAPLSWRLSPKELADQVDLVRPVLVVAESAYADLAQDTVALARRRVECAELGEVGLEQSIPRAGSAAARQPVLDDDPLLLVLTSGTSGRSKAVVLTHANCHWTNESLHRALSFSDTDVVLGVMPQYHVGGWNVQPLLILRVGGLLVLERRFEPGRALRLIEEHGVSALMGVPTNYLQMAQHPEFLHTDLSTLRVAVTGGAPAPLALLRMWHDRGVALTQGYGLSESGPNVTCLPAAESVAAAGSVGYPYPFVEVALRTDQGVIEHGAAEGEILVRGPQTMAGYLDDPEATSAAFIEGWLRTGDRARRDSAGRLWIVDRIKDIFISGGESVAPVEIENALLEHPDIAEIAVAGVPDDTWGERAVAWVVPRAGSGLRAEDVIAFARGRLAGFKVPTRALLVDRIPRSGADKPLRRQLVADFLDLRGTGAQQ